MLQAKLNTLDRYEILGELGRGAISIVYDARDLLTGDPVALKLIEPSLWSPPASAAERLRFLTEVMPEWRLRHPNIVRVYDAGDGNGRIYIAMQRLEGRTLRRVLDESPLPDVPCSLRMAAGLASGLAHAHARGVVHRCLKPSNIFVLADDRAKITDFGMAPLRDAALASPNHAASLSYMSPEGIRCDATIDERLDIFSLGVVLYEMLTGERPFCSDSPDEIKRNVLEAEPPLPSEVNADVPPMVDLLVWSMLAKRPFDRASSAEVVARRLRRLGEEVGGALAAHASGDRKLVLMPGHRGDGRAPSAEILAGCFRGLGEEVDGALTAHARDEEVFTAGTTDEGGSDDRNVVDDRAPSAEILVHGEPGEEVDGVLTAHAPDEEVSTAAGTTDEGTFDDRDVVLMPGHRGDDRAPSAEILVHGEPGEEVDGVLTAHAPDEEVSAAETTDEGGSDDRNVALMPGHRGDDRAPSAEILVHGEPGAEVDGVLTAHARDEEVFTAGTTDEGGSDDRNVVLMPGHRGDDRAPSAEILVHGEPGAEADGVLTAHAPDEEVFTAGTTDEGGSDDRNVALMPGHRGDDRAPSAEILVHGEPGAEADGVLTADARDEEVSTAAGTTDEGGSDDRDVALMPGHRGDDRAPSAEILVHGEPGAEADGVLTAHAPDEEVFTAAGTTDEGTFDDRDVVLMPGSRGDDRAPSAEILVHGEPGAEADGVLTAHAPDEEVFTAGTTDEGGSDDRNVALMPGHRGDDRAPSAEILVHGEPGAEADGVLTADARDEEVSTAAGTTDEGGSDDRDVALMPGHRGDDRAPSAEILVHGEPGAEADGVLTAHAPDEEVFTAAGTTDEGTFDDRDVVLMPGSRGDDRAPSAEILVHGEPGAEADGVLTADARDEEVSTAAGTTDEGGSDDRDVALMPGHRGDDRAPSAEILVHGEPGAEADGVLTAHAPDEEVFTAAGTTDEGTFDDRDVALMPGHRGEDGAPSEIFLYPLPWWGEEVDDALTTHARGERAFVAGMTGEGVSGERSAALMPGHRGGPQRAKLRLPAYALTVLILAVAGSGFLWQWRQSSGLSEVDSVTPSEKPATAITFEPSIPDEPRLSASAPEPEKAASAPEPEKAASAPEPEKAVSESEPQKRATKAPARKPSRSVVASGSAPAQEIELPAAARVTEPASAPLPPPAKTGTLVFDISPWGEIYVDGKRHGTTPPINTLDLPPGRHRIELRYSAQPPYVSYTTLEAGDVRRIRYQFE